MDASRDLRPLFIRKDEIPPRGVIVTVSKAERKDNSRTTDEADFQWLLTFREGWLLWLNPKTGNLRKMIELCGNETDDWVGKRIGLRLKEFENREGGTSSFIEVCAAAEVALKRKPPAKLKPLEQSPEDEIPPDNGEEIPFE